LRDKLHVQLDWRRNGTRNGRQIDHRVYISRGRIRDLGHVLELEIHSRSSRYTSLTGNNSSQDFNASTLGAMAEAPVKRCDVTCSGQVKLDTLTCHPKSDVDFSIQVQLPDQSKKEFLLEGSLGVDPAIEYLLLLDTFPGLWA